jgi:hypothetical protein
MSDDSEFQINSSVANNKTLAKFLNFKIRNQYINYPDQPYQKPITASILKVINKLFLMLGLFGCLWFSIFYSYLYFSIFYFVAFFLTFTLIIFALAYLTLMDRIAADTFVILLVLMFVSSSFWFINVKF